MNKYKSIFPVIVLFLLSSPAVLALAVSDVELLSRLNQQLDARVYLKNADKTELTSLNISIRNIVDDGEGMANLHYEVLENAQGHYISITSEDVIREPVMRFMLELNWSKGRLIREYALIIDPQ